MKKNFLGKALCICAFIIFTSMLSIWLFLCRPFSGEKQADIQNIKSGSYELVFLSMFPTDNYTCQPFTSRYGMNTLISSYEIPNYYVLEEYLQEIAETSGISLVYLGIRPDKIESRKLAELLAAYPDITFEVLTAYPSMDYWLSLSESKCSQLLQAYEDCIRSVWNLENVSLYWFTGWEWLIGNPDNYEEEFLTTEEISSYIMYHMDTLYVYDLQRDPSSDETPVAALKSLIEQYRAAPAQYCDLSGWNIVFFGDSVIGNYEGSASIPGVVGALTKADVYNMGLGGSCMTQGASLSLPEILSVFLNGRPDQLPPDSMVRTGMTEYLQALNQPDATDRDVCFVINYGLNDYFSGQPMYSQDPYDVHTFTGAVRSCVRMLREAYPQAPILLNTPNLVSYFDNGTQPHYESYILVDYVNALKELAVELDLTLLDNYNELGFTEDNLGFYTDDGCHPNEIGRFLVGQKISQKLGDMIP